MNVAKKIDWVTPKEFEAMEKDERFTYELIDGVVMMSPSPGREHQSISGKMYIALHTALNQTDCQPLYEYDITAGDNTFKPDPMVFCDEESELPEIVFEIISPTSRRRDLQIKVAKYEEAGIKEYWIVDPDIKTITVHDYINQTVETYTIGQTIQSKAQPEIILAVADISRTKGTI